MDIKVNEELLKYLGFKLDGNRWIHEKGTFIYLNNIPEDLKSLVEIMTGTAYKKGYNNKII